MYTGYSREIQALKQKLIFLESGLARANDECETRVATIKASKDICPEPVNSVSMSEFVNSMPPEFASRFSAEIARNLAPGLCEKMPDRFSKKRKQKPAFHPKPLSPDDTTAESAEE